MSSFIWSLIVNPVIGFFSWFRAKLSGDTMGQLEYHPDDIHVIVKAPKSGGTGSKAATVTLDPEMSISDVKSKVKNVMQFPDEEIRIILAGRELDDQIKVRDCDLGEKTVIHAVSGSRSRVKPVQYSALLGQTPGNVYREQRAHFYVYCDEETCDEGLQPGKLRVRCAECHDGSLVVHIDPCGWQDVLEPGRIVGSCQQCLQ